MKYKNATQYISLNDAVKGVLVIGYAYDNCLSKASLPMERGVGRIYSQRRGRGHKKIFWGFAPRPLQVLYYFLAPPPPNPKCAPRSLVHSVVFLAHFLMSI